MEKHIITLFNDTFILSTTPAADDATHSAIIVALDPSFTQLTPANAAALRRVVGGIKNPIDLGLYQGFQGDVPAEALTSVLSVINIVALKTLRLVLSLRGTEGQFRDLENYVRGNLTGLDALYSACTLSVMGSSSSSSTKQLIRAFGSLPLRYVIIDALTFNGSGDGRVMHEWIGELGNSFNAKAFGVVASPDKVISIVDALLDTRFSPETRFVLILIPEPGDESPQASVDTHIVGTKCARLLSGNTSIKKVTFCHDSVSPAVVLLALEGLAKSQVCAFELKGFLKPLSVSDWSDWGIEKLQSVTADLKKNFFLEEFTWNHGECTHPILRLFEMYAKLNATGRRKLLNGTARDDAWIETLAAMSDDTPCVLSLLLERPTILWNASAEEPNFYIRQMVPEQQTQAPPNRRKVPTVDM